MMAGMVEWNDCGAWVDNWWIGNANDWSVGWTMGMGAVGVWVSWEMEGCHSGV